MRQIHAIKKICQVLQIADPGQLSYNSEKIPVLQLQTGDKISGLVSILNHLVEVSNNKTFTEATVDDSEKEFLISSWLEYSNLFVHTISTSDEKPLIKGLLDELNNYLVIRSYLVGESITIADLIVFYFIQDTMKYLTYLDKENYLNLSRWYNHIQQLAFIQTEEKQINLSTTYLVGWATGTHI